MDRTFHHRLTVSSVLLAVMLSFLALSFFWHPSGNNALVGVMIVILVIVVVEREIHTKYVLTAGCLRIIRGRFSPTVEVPLGDIVKVERVNGRLLLVTYVLIVCGDGRRVSVKPYNPCDFVNVLTEKINKVRLQ
ncbi:hypothetical protein [Xylanibacter muris]|uniref:PH domain-containing protein n=1 Tax=Xylanibacter muris TaxID=2736290 RepID=A0ABX2AM05_9BACT|nr:hypothetical protein [Xylanibacter muris]NPD92150.1 hypothetical protein [Xylanibacter muris]